MSTRKTQSHTLEYKKPSAQLFVDSDQPVSKTAIDLGIKPGTLHGWVNKYHPKKRKTQDQNNPITSDLLAELKQLKKETPD